MSDPFDDPEIRAAMEAHGVAHRPGMAKEMLDRLAPLMKGDGIDLDNLDDDADLDAVADALARATERYNLELFTPVGAHRADSLRALARFSDLLAADFLDEAFDLLDSIPVEPGRSTAAASHVIGASLGLLDEWYADAALRPALLAARAPKIPGVPRGAAREILRAAYETEAFSAIDSLIVAYAGKAVLDGAALAVAAAIGAIANAEGDTPANVSNRLLLGGGNRATPRAAPRASVFGSAFGRAAAAAPQVPVISLESRAALRDFGAWLTSESTAEPVSVSVKDDVGILRTLFKLATEDGIDLCDPADMGFAVELIEDVVDPVDPEADEAFMSMIAILDEYVHFRLDLGERAEEWSEAHEILEDALTGGQGFGPLQGMLRDVIEEERTLDPADLSAALDGTRIVSAVRELLEFVGRSHPITSTGALRRKDIEPVAALLGIRAVGVAAQPARGGVTDGFVYAHSMWDVPTLAAWWQALRLTELIDVGVTVVRPGPASGEWLASEHPPREIADMLVGVFIAGLLTSDTGFYDGDDISAGSIARVLALLIDIPGDENDEGTFREQLIAGVAGRRLGELERVGVLARDPASGEFTVPRALRGVLARGATLAITYLTTSRGLDPEDGATV